MWSEVISDKDEGDGIWTVSLQSPIMTNLSPDRGEQGRIDYWELKTDTMVGGLNSNLYCYWSYKTLDNQMTLRCYFTPHTEFQFFEVNKTIVERFMFPDVLLGRCLSFVSGVWYYNRISRDESHGKKCHARTMMYSKPIKLSKWTHTMYHSDRLLWK